MKTEPLTTTLDALPWPKTGDKLIDSGGNRWNEIAHVSSHASLCSYSSSFETCATNLVNMVLDGTEMPDFVFLPAAFLYRHALELSLKKIILLGKWLQDEKVEIPLTHQFSKLWPMARRTIEQFWSGGPKTDLNAAEKTILELSSLDDTNEEFRYPNKRGGDISLAGLTKVDLRNFSQVMQGTLTFLNAIICELDDYYQNRATSW